MFTIFQVPGGAGSAAEPGVIGKLASSLPSFQHVEHFFLRVHLHHAAAELRLRREEPTLWREGGGDERRGHIRHPHGVAGAQGAEILSGIELRQKGPLGVDAFREQLQQGSVGKRLALALVFTLFRDRADLGEVFGGDRVIRECPGPFQARHLVVQCGIRSGQLPQASRPAVAGQRLAGELAAAPVDLAGAEVFLVEKDLQPRRILQRRKRRSRPPGRERCRRRDPGGKPRRCDQPPFRPRCQRNRRATRE